MIFSSELLNNQETKIKTPEKKTADINTCFFIEALNNILYEDSLFESIMETHTKAVNEGLITLALIGGAGFGAYNHIKDKINSEEFKDTINSIKNFDFSLSNIITKLVEGFIKLLKKLYKEFEVICMNIVSKSTQIHRFKNKISLIGETIKYSEPYYNYTNIRNSTTYSDIETTLLNDFNNITRALNDIDHMSDVEINQKLNNLNNESLYDDYDILRGNILGTNSLIKEENYATELFKYFRDGKDEPFLYGYIDPNDLHKRLNDFSLASKTIKLCQKDKDKMEKAGNRLVNDFKSIKLSRYSNMTSTRISYISNIVNNYIHKTKNICNIYLLYFSSKLDAAKDELLTNKNLLFEACKYIVREGL